MYLKVGEKNFKIALANGVWGFPVSPKGITRGLEKLMQIKKGDILVFVNQWSSNKGENVPGGRLPANKFLGSYSEIIVVTVTKGFYEDTKIIWNNALYPYRVNFRKEVLFKGRNIPCNPKFLGKSLHEILRKLQCSGSVERIDSSLIVKLMSLCVE